MNHRASSIVSTQLAVRVTRCGCTPAQKRAADWHAAYELPCPNPLRCDDLGVIAFGHRNPFVTFLWRVTQRLRGRKPGTATFIQE